MQSIFSGWTPESLRTLRDTALGSKEGLVFLSGFGLIVVLVIALVGLYVSHRVGGFFTRIQEEDEAARREEAEMEEAAKAAKEDET